MVGLTVTFGAGEPDQGIPPQTRVYHPRPGYTRPDQTTVFLALLSSRQMGVSCIVAIQTELLDLNQAIEITIDGEHYCLDASVLDLMTLSGRLEWIRICHQIWDCWDCLIGIAVLPPGVLSTVSEAPFLVCPVSYQLYEGVSHTTAWGGRWPEESRFESPAESSLRRVVCS